MAEYWWLEQFLLFRRRTLGNLQQSFCQQQIEKLTFPQDLQSHDRNSRIATKHDYITLLAIKQIDLVRHSSSEEAAFCMFSNLRC
jgi:hypothetical protein